MSVYYLDWVEDHIVWSSETRIWDDVYIIIEELLEQSGARDPQEWGDHPFDVLEDDQKFDEIRDQLQRNLDRMSDQNKSKLIEIMLTIGEAKVLDKKSSRKDIHINVENIRIIAKQFTVEVSNVRER